MGAIRRQPRAKQILAQRYDLAAGGVAQSAGGPVSRCSYLDGASTRPRRSERGSSGRLNQQITPYNCVGQEVSVNGTERA